MRSHSPVCRGTPVRIAAAHKRYFVQDRHCYGKEFLELSAVRMFPGGEESWRSRITREQIERLSTWDSGTNGSVTDFNLTIHLRDKVEQEFQTPYRRRKHRSKILSLHADVPTIVLLVQFLLIPSAKH